MHHVISQFCRRTLLFPVIVTLAFLSCVPAFAETAFPNVTTDQLKQMIDTKANMVLVDARTPEEYAIAHIVTAISIPEKAFETAIAQLPKDKASRLVLYCNGIKCGKSKKLAAKLEPLGYTNIMIYGEGMPVWEERALPIVTGPGYGKKIETTKLKPAEVDALVKGGKSDFVIVDVRDEMEFEEGHIPGAVNIPVEQFAAKSDRLPKEKKVIVYCNTGSRSYLAYKKLIGLSYPSIYQTLFVEWKEAGLPVAK